MRNLQHATKQQTTYRACRKALNKAAYADDAQIVDAHIIKRYSNDPRVEVEIGEIKDL